MSQDAYLIRWRGEQQGPHTMETLQELLASRKIGMLHEVLYRDDWISVRDFLAFKEREYREELAGNEARERQAREEQERQGREAAAQREAAMIAEEKRKNDLLQMAMDMQKHSGAGESQTSDTSSARVFGALLLIAGVAVAGYYFVAFDPSVSTGTGMRVNNIGLMQQQQNGLIIGMGLSLVGILMVLLGGRSSNK